MTNSKPRNSLKNTKVCDECNCERIIWKTENKKKLCKTCSAKLVKNKSTTTQTKKPKKKSLSKLKDHLDIVFSKYIRLRDSDSSGFAKCCTCGSLHFWKDIQCGHFISRRHLSTRWEPKNCNAQCQSCNIFKSGEQFLHSLYIQQKYGDKELPHAILLQSNEVFKIERVWIESQIDFYSNKVDELLKEKNLTR